MTDNPSDARLRATELQMRRALGLDREAPSRTSTAHTPSLPSGPHQRRHFVRDGEVPVTVIHRHNGHDIAGELDEARQALAAQTAAHEEAARALTDARNAIHDLETKLGHERLANNEMTERIDSEKRRIEEALAAAQEELAIERAQRARAERERDEATVARETAEMRLRQLTAAKPVEDDPLATFLSTATPRRRGRPSKIAQQQSASDDSGVVEWWLPGWQEKYR